MVNHISVYDENLVLTVGGTVQLSLHTFRGCLQAKGPDKGALDQKADES